jgi:lysophospholipase L1-like esterase
VLRRAALLTGGVLLGGILVAGCGGTDAGDVDAQPAVEEQKVTVSGDSISVGLGVALREEVAAEELDVTVIGEGGTGIARPDRFDWPARLEALAREFPPEVLVFSVGSNDGQDLFDPAGEQLVPYADREAWDAEYRARLARAFDAFADTGTTVVWVGHVRADDELVADTNRRIHELAVAEAASRDWVEVADLAELTGSGAEETSECLVDGLHLTADCYATAAEALLAEYAPA